MDVETMYTRVDSLTRRIAKERMPHHRIYKEVLALAKEYDVIDREYLLVCVGHMEQHECSDANCAKSAISQAIGQLLRMITRRGTC